MTSNLLSADAPERRHVKAQLSWPKSLPADSKRDDNQQHYRRPPAPGIARAPFFIVLIGIGASNCSWMAKWELLGVGQGVQCGGALSLHC